MRRAVAVLVLATLLLPAVEAPAAACSCRPASPQQHLARATVAFTGRIGSVSGPERTPNDLLGTGKVTYHFEVDRVLKGAVASNARLRTDSSPLSCGLDLEVGERYTVFAYSREGVLGADLCGGTHRGDPDPSLTDMGTLLGPDQDLPPAGWVTGVIALTLVGVGVLAVRRRRAAPMG